MTASSSSRRAAMILVAALALLAAALPARAEEWSLACLGGSHLSDADLARGTTIVVVWASWSPRSRDIAERVNALNGRWGSRARVVTVSFQEERPAVEAFMKGKSFGAPVCLDSDGTFARKYNVATLPGLMVFKDGQSIHRGKLADDADQVLGGLLH